MSTAGHNPLISILILSYNNYDYIRDCIDSCLAQDYENIEIIISDDCSNDNVKHVILDYSRRYSEIIKIRFSKINQGIVNNFNSGCKLCKGQWIKPIASDDLLINSCISDFIQFINKKKIRNGFIFSDAIIFGYSNKEKIINGGEIFLSLTYQNQQEKILEYNPLLAPTAFLNNNSLIELGFADDRYPHIEDYPLWLKAVENRLEFHYLKKTTVKYRKHNSITYTTDKIGNKNYYTSLYQLKKEKIWPKRSGLNILANIEEFVELKRIIYSIKLLKNNRNFIYYLIKILLIPLKINTFRNFLKSKIEEI
jgi:glycosyltransferase involved in cell wall biosynthesis